MTVHSSDGGAGKQLKQGASETEQSVPVSASASRLGLLLCLRLRLSFFQKKIIWQSLYVCIRYGEKKCLILFRKWMNESYQEEEEEEE